MQNNDTLNPYASPAVPSEPGLDEHRTIVAAFEVDELVQRDAARGYRIRHALILASTLLTIPLCMLVSWPFFGMGRWWEAVIYGFAIGAAVTIGLHIALDWLIFFHNLRQLRQHPILGFVGHWQVQIDERRLIVANVRGQQEWPLDAVRRMELNARPIVLWLEPDLAIALPKHGDYFEDDYATVRKTIRRRILHIGGAAVDALVGWSASFRAAK